MHRYFTIILVILNNLNNLCAELWLNTEWSEGKWWDTDREVTGSSLISIVTDTRHFVVSVQIGLKTGRSFLHEKTLLSAAHRQLI